MKTDYIVQVLRNRSGLVRMYDVLTDEAADRLEVLQSQNDRLLQENEELRAELAAVKRM